MSDHPTGTQVQPRPSAVTMFSAVLIVLLVSLASATGSYVILRDPFGFVLVFLFVVFVMVVVLPYFLLSTGYVNQSTWLKTYVMVLEKMPGFDAIFKSMVDHKKR